MFTLPRVLDLREYLGSRDKEVAAAFEALKAAGKPVGIKAQPRNLRRRTRSHNPYRHRKRPNKKRGAKAKSDSAAAAGEPPAKRARTGIDVSHLGPSVVRWRARDRRPGSAFARIVRGLASRAERASRLLTLPSNIPTDVVSDTPEEAERVAAARRDAAASTSAPSHVRLESHAWAVRRMRMGEQFGHEVALGAAGRARGDRSVARALRADGRGLVYDASSSQPLAWEGPRGDLIRGLLAAAADPQQASATIERRSPPETATPPGRLPAAFTVELATAGVGSAAGAAGPTSAPPRSLGPCEFLLSPAEPGSSEWVLLAWLQPAVMNEACAVLGAAMAAAGVGGWAPVLNRIELRGVGALQAALRVLQPHGNPQGDIKSDPQTIWSSAREASLAAEAAVAARRAASAAEAEVEAATRERGEAAGPGPKSSKAEGASAGKGRLKGAIAGPSASVPPGGEGTADVAPRRPKKERRRGGGGGSASRPTAALESTWRSLPPGTALCLTRVLDPRARKDRYGPKAESGGGGGAAAAEVARPSLAPLLSLARTASAAHLHGSLDTDTAAAMKEGGSGPGLPPSEAQRGEVLRRRAAEALVLAPRRSDRAAEADTPLLRASLPLLVLKGNGPAHQPSASLILPPGWGRVVWLALVREGVKAAGAEEARWADGAWGWRSYPQDYPGTLAYDRWAAAASAAAAAQDARRPPGRRPAPTPDAAAAAAAAALPGRTVTVNGAGSEVVLVSLRAVNTKGGPAGVLRAGDQVSLRSPEGPLVPAGTVLWGPPRAAPVGAPALAALLPLPGLLGALEAAWKANEEGRKSAAEEGGTRGEGPPKPGPRAEGGLGEGQRHAEKASAAFVVHRLANQNKEGKGVPVVAVALHKLRGGIRLCVRWQPQKLLRTAGAIASQVSCPKAE